MIYAQDGSTIEWGEIGLTRLVFITVCNNERSLWLSHWNVDNWQGLQWEFSPGWGVLSQGSQSGDRGVIQLGKRQGDISSLRRWRTCGILYSRALWRSGHWMFLKEKIDRYLDTKDTMEREQTERAQSTFYFSMFILLPQKAYWH